MADPLSIFLRRLHRRYVALRLIESAGLGVLGACALGLIAIPILLYRSEPAIPTALALLAIGAVCGLAFGLWHRPTPLDAAVAADTQLHLADLLATAYLLTRAKRDMSPFSFAGAVLALAEQRCRTLSPSAVLLNRLGARAWGGIGLATALLLTLGLLSTNPLPSEASSIESAAKRRLLSSRLGAENVPTASSIPTPNASANLPRGNGDGDENPRDTQTTTVKAHDPANVNNTAGANPNGTGAGSAKSNTTQKPTDPVNSATASNHADPSGTQSGGVGATSPTPGSPGHSGTSAGGSNNRQSIPPWQSSSWPAAREQALLSLHATPLPPKYDDLIRGYFER